MTPIVSVLIPCHNAAPWLRTALDSVLAQRGVELDVVVVDDGSTDESAAIARSYESRGVRIVRQSGLGAAVARNAALRLASGAYIQYLDADDLLGHGKLAEQVEVLAANPGCVAISRTVHFRDGTDPSSGVTDDNGPWRNSADGAQWLLEMWEGAMVHPAAYLVPADVAARAGPWADFLSNDDDGEYFCRVLLASNGVVRTEPAVSYYRKHPDGLSLSSARTAELQWSALRSLDLRAAAFLAARDTLPARRVIARAYMERAVLAYPRNRDVSDAALQRVAELGGTDYVPYFGSRSSHLVRDLFGWKAARWASTYWHRLVRGRRE